MVAICNSLMALVRDKDLNKTVGDFQAWESDGYNKRERFFQDAGFLGDGELGGLNTALDL